VITVNVPTEKQAAGLRILDTIAKNLLTGNRHLFESFNPMAKGDHQVKAADASLLNAEGSGKISFYVDRPSAKPAMILLQHVLYVHGCGTNNHLRIIQLMRKGVNFELNFNGAIASLGSVLVYQPPLINNKFIIRASPSTSTSMVFDTLNPV